MRRYCLALDLVDKPELIFEYERWHSAGNGWREVKTSILNSGITDMQIYRTGNRLFMIIDTDNSFSFERKAALDAANPAVVEWEKLMSKFQKPIEWAGEGEKWVLMEQIFQL